MSGKRILKIEVLGDSKDAQQSFDDLGISAGDVVSKVGEIGGALAGAALTGHLEDSTVSLGKLQAQLGLTNEETAALGEVARTVYTNNFGESIGEATRVTGLLHQALGTTGEELAEATEDVFRITDAFGELGAEPDIIAENVRVMKQAFPDKSDAEILDLIAFGFQEGAGRSGDLQDSLQEYPRFFSEIGLSGEDMMNFFNTGMDAGARNSDLLGDAVKEMGIIIQETGSDGQIALQNMFGEDEAESLITNFAAGGEAGREAFFTILEGLNEIEDPLERNRVATELFGTKGEDLAGVLDDMLPAFLATKDGMNEVGDVTGTLDAQYVGMGSTLEGFKRKFESSLIGPLGSVGAPAQEAITAFGGIATGLTGLSALGIDVGGTISSLGSKLLAVVSPTNLVTAAQWLYNAALTANPIGLVVVALGLLVGGLILAYTQSETFREIVNGAWESIYETVLPILGWFTDTLVPFFTDTIPETFRTFREMSVGEIVGLAGEMLTKAPEVIKNIVTGMANLLYEGAGGAFGLWVSFNTRVYELLGTLGTWLLTEAGPTLVRKIVEGLKDLFSEDNITGAVGQFAKMNEMVNTKLMALATWLVTEGGPAVVSKLVSGLKDLFSLDNAIGVIGQFAKLQTELNTKTGEIATSALSWGAQIVQGIIDGFITKSGELASAVGTYIVSAVKNSVTSGFGIFSPSKVMKGYGENTVEGFIVGIEDTIDKLIAALKKFTDAIVGALNVELGIPSTNESEEGYEAGQAVGHGVALGLDDAEPEVARAGGSLGRAAVDSTAEGMAREAGSLGVNSAPNDPPPTVGGAIGAGFGVGVAGGIIGAEPEVHEAGQRVGGALARGTQEGIEDAWDGYDATKWFDPDSVTYPTAGDIVGNIIPETPGEKGLDLSPDGGSGEGSSVSSGGGGGPVGVFSGTGTPSTGMAYAWGGTVYIINSDQSIDAILNWLYIALERGIGVIRVRSNMNLGGVPFGKGSYPIADMIHAASMVPALTSSETGSGGSLITQSSGGSGGGGIGGGINLTVNLGNEQLINSVFDAPLPGMSLSAEI